VTSSPRPMRVKFILPALTEATDPYWRPVKYSLFPPLGLATLAAYLGPDDEARIVDEHVEPLTLLCGGLEEVRAALGSADSRTPTHACHAVA